MAPSQTHDQGAAFVGIDAVHMPPRVYRDGPGVDARPAPLNPYLALSSAGSGHTLDRPITLPGLIRRVLPGLAHLSGGSALTAD